MTIYYLMVKTHQKSGLKYLCQTIRKDFDKYKGSGKYWARYLRKHGADIRTEVIRECYSEEELKYWGLHYTEYYRVLSAMDDYGNRIWANMKPEDGKGGSIKGLKRTAQTKKNISRARVGNKNAKGKENKVVAKMNLEKRLAKYGCSSEYEIYRKTLDIISSHTFGTRGIKPGHPNFTQIVKFFPVTVRSTSAAETLRVIYTKFSLGDNL